MTKALKAQLYDGERLAYDPDRKLVDNISTDELTPGWVCYYYDETLARYCLVGLRGGAIEKDELLMQAASLGAVEVIMKPFDFRQLVGAVSRALGR